MHFHDFVIANVSPLLPRNMDKISLASLDRDVIGSRWYHRLISLYDFYYKLRSQAVPAINTRTTLKTSPLSLLCYQTLYGTFVWACEVLQDTAWEKMNTGHWSEVDPAWRTFYSHALLLKFMVTVLCVVSHRPPLSLVKFLASDDSVLSLLPPDQIGCPTDQFILAHTLLGYCDKGILMGLPPCFVSLGGDNLSLFVGLGEVLTTYITSQPSYVECVLRNRPLDTKPGALNHNVSEIPRENDADIAFGTFIPTPLNLMVGNDGSGDILPCLNYPLPRISQPSIREFQRGIMGRGEPVVLLDTLDDWPCFGNTVCDRDRVSSCKWDLPYLLERCGPRLVPVEVGSRYTDSQWYQELMPFWKFVTLFVLRSDGGTKGYLAQHLLFEQVPSLKRDFVTPVYCACTLPSHPDRTASRDYKLHIVDKTELYEEDRPSLGSSPPHPRDQNCKRPKLSPTNGHEALGEDEDVEVNCWFGPAGTVSPLHHDPKPNLLCQVFGIKYVRLYHPSDSNKLYAYGETDLLSANTSPVNVEEPDLLTYPEFVKAPYKECLLGAGQALYIPPRHWHFVKSLTPSFSVNFWW